MKKKIGLTAVIAAGLLLAGLHPFGWTFLSWFAFLPFFLLFFDPSVRRRDLAAAAFLTGAIYYGIGLYWLFYFKIWAYFFVFAISAPVFAGYFLLLGLMSNRGQAGKYCLSPVESSKNEISRSFGARNDTGEILSAAFLWVLIDKIYALTPLGAISVEVPFYGPLAFLQVASIGGLGPLAGIITGLNAAIACRIKTHSRVALIWIFIFASALAGIYVWGSRRIGAETLGSLHAVLVQHNLPVSGAWAMEHPIYIRSQYRELALKAAARRPDIIIFPLFDFPEDILRQPSFFLGLAQETKSYILVAAHIPKTPGGKIMRDGFINTAVLFSPQGKIAGKYQAVHAPPFGQAPEVTQNEYGIMETPFGRLGILLCFEDSIPSVAKRAVKEGAQILIALSNPGFFTATHMPYYHLMQDRLRAIESSRWVLRVSANGYSAAIDPRGRWIQKSRLNQPELLEVQANLENRVTFYDQTPDWF